jgi:hypothetical protein
MIKKIILFILILCLYFSIIGCDSNPVTPSSNNNYCAQVDLELSGIVKVLDLTEDWEFYDYTHSYSGCQRLDNALNKKMDPDINLSYKDFILNAIYEEELIEDSLSQPFDKDIENWENNLSNIQNGMTSFISEQLITGMIELMGMPTLAIGISSIFYASQLFVIGNMISDLEEIYFRKSLHNYLLMRKEFGCSHSESWPPNNFLPIYPQCNNGSTEIFFQNIWNNYGYAISDNVDSLDSSFKYEQHNILKELILKALKPSLLASEEIELIRKWGFGGDYVVRWPNGYVDVYDETNYSNINEIIDEWNSVIGGPVIFRLSNNYNSPVKLVFDESLEWEDLCGDAQFDFGEDYAFTNITIMINPKSECLSISHPLYLFLFNCPAGFNAWAEVSPCPFETWSNFYTISDTIKTMVHALHKVPPGYYLGEGRSMKNKIVDTNEQISLIKSGN